MIKQAAIGLNSRSEANPYNEEGVLPIITAPMYSVVDETNYQIFLDNKIQVCLPRSNKAFFSDKYFISMSLENFKESFIDNAKFHLDLNKITKICIDTANGNMPALHEAICKAKEIHGDSLVIMAGNVASVEAFVELAKTGVDYIRVGIGGSGGCNTTSNTGVGNPFGDLEYLVAQCSIQKQNYKQVIKRHHDNWNRTNSKPKESEEKYFGKEYIKWNNLSKVKIVADGISSYVKQCETKYGFNDNGYAAINKLLFAGADLVMIGKLFAQCFESAGEKWVETFTTDEATTEHIRADMYTFKQGKRTFRVKYSGMSTLEEQKKYRNKVATDQTPSYRPSEGSTSWIPVRWTLSEWLHGSEDQDTYPYLMGWVNSIKSAMSYQGIKQLN